MLSRMCRVYGVAASTFHQWIGPLLTFTGIFVLFIINSIGFLLDYLFFPSLWKKKITVIIFRKKSRSTI